jgi:hypothetical protein
MAFSGVGGGLFACQGRDTNGGSGDMYIFMTSPPCDHSPDMVLPAFQGGTLLW